MLFRSVELGLLEAVGGDDGNFLALEFVAAEDAHSDFGNGKCGAGSNAGWLGLRTEKLRV